MSQRSVESEGKMKTAEIFEWLDDLRDGGSVNMFGAAPYVADAFHLSLTEARKVTMAWAKTFDREKTAAERAALAHQ